MPQPEMRDPAPPRTVPEVLARAAAQYPDRPALVSAGRAGESFTFAELERESDELALALLELGVVAEERVGLLSENRPRWGAAYFAIHKAGAIAVPIDALLREREVGEIGRAAELRFVLVSEKLEPVARAALPRARLLSLDGSATAFVSYPELLRRGRTSLRQEQMLERSVSAGQLAAIIFTSGTTGRPKGVALSHRNLAANVHSVLETIPVGPADRMLSVLPLHHTFECTAGMLMPLAAGVTVYYARSLKSKELAEDLRESQPTIMLGVPLLFEKMLAGLERRLEEGNLLARGFFLPAFRALRAVRAPLGFGRLLLAPVRARAGLARSRFLVSGAAAMPHGVCLGFRALGVEVLQGYGLTEAAPVIAVNPIGRARAGAVGPPIAGVEIRVDSPGADGVGEVLVRGENVMEGYYGEPALTTEAMDGDWLRTGDLGRLDDDGYLYLRGRRKSMIATGGGKKIFPEEVEAVLCGSPLIADALVYGRKDARGHNEDVAAVIVPDLEAVAARLRAEAAHHGGHRGAHPAAPRPGPPDARQSAWLGARRGPAPEAAATAAAHAAAPEAAARGAAPAGSAAVPEEAVVRALLKAEVARVCAQLAEYKRVRDIKVRHEELPRTTIGKVKRYLFTDGEEQAVTGAGAVRATPSEPVPRTVAARS
ncbi:MAG TPA: AMP-binding protein [Candidatus Saccharimonadales bacterium]|nr:AMP-binding protein [Candidatus Saccharimonadales bacterium]